MHGDRKNIESNIKEQLKEQNSSDTQHQLKSSQKQGGSVFSMQVRTRNMFVCARIRTANIYIHITYTYYIQACIRIFADDSQIFAAVAGKVLNVLPEFVFLWRSAKRMPQHPGGSEERVYMQTHEHASTRIFLIQYK